MFPYRASLASRAITAAFVLYFYDFQRLSRRIIYLPDDRITELIDGVPCVSTYVPKQVPLLTQRKTKTNGE